MLLMACFTEPPSADPEGTTGSSGAATTSGPLTTGVTQAVTSGPGSSETSSAESTATGSTTDDMTCGDMFDCVVPPAEWEGPILLRVEDEGVMPPECPANTQEIWRGGTEPAAACNCNDCSVESPLCDIQFDWGGFGTCDMPIDTLGCSPIPATEKEQFFMTYSTEPVMGGSCASPTPSAPFFRTRAVACEPPGGSCADGGACVTGRRCIWRPGDEMCPEAYPDRLFVHEDVQGENLSCSTCDCGDAAVPCSGVELTVYASEDCSGTPFVPTKVSGPSQAQCTSYESTPTVFTNQVGSISIEVDGDDCASLKSFELAAGQFIPEGPRTVCCSG